jgi:hypothetical protein
LVNELGDRIDYVRLSRKFDVQRGLAWTGVLRDIIERYQNDHPDVKGNFKVGTVKRYDDGEYLYTVQVWGDLCGFVTRLDFGRYAKYVTRLDFRMELAVTKDGLASLGDVAKQNNSASRNITSYDTRARDKKEGRHAGGIGLALGSHGSTKRLTFYKRGNEKGAMEYQTQMTECSKIINRAIDSASRDTAPDNASKWAYVLMHGLDTGMQFASTAFNLDFDSIVEVANANSPNTDNAELITHTIKADWRRLGKAEKRELLYQLTLEL